MSVCQLRVELFVLFNFVALILDISLFEHQLFGVRWVFSHVFHSNCTRSVYSDCLRGSDGIASQL